MRDTLRVVVSRIPPIGSSIAWRRGAVIAALVLSVQPVVTCRAADEPTGFIPSIRATVTGLSFFAGGGDVMAYRQRRYDERFLADTLGFVHWQLDLSHPAAGRRLPFVIEEVWQGPQGVRRRHTQHFTMDPSWTRSNWTSNARLVLSRTVTVPSRNDVFRCRGVTGEWGPCDAASDVNVYYWPRGPYRVDLFVENSRIASGQFRLLGQADIDAEVRAKLADRSVPTGHIGPLNGRIGSLRFFDAGPPLPRAQDRRYATQFSASGTKSIGWQLDVKHEAAGRWRPLTFEALWYRADAGDRRLVHRKVTQVAVSADWTNTSFDDDSDVLPGGWPTPGTYLLDLYLERQKVAGGSFTVR